MTQCMLEAFLVPCTCMGSRRGDPVIQCVALSLGDFCILPIVPASDILGHVHGIIKDGLYCNPTFCAYIWNANQF